MVIIGLLKYLEDCVNAMDEENIDVMKFTAQEQIKRIERQLHTKESLCQYDKMCVKKRININCPSDCNEDTRQ